jgi:predicted nucleotidyltransferase
LDNRYKPIIDLVVQRFAIHLGPRLTSAYVKGSVARGDAVWGISDLDLVLAFKNPTQEDNFVKHRLEADVRSIPGGDALVIQRIADDRLEQMEEKTKAFWIYSSLYDSEVVYGKHPRQILPAPSKGTHNSILSVIYEDGKDIPHLTSIDEEGCRSVAKRILLSFSIFLVQQGHAEYIPLLVVPRYPLPLKIQQFLPSVINLYSNPRPLTDVDELINYWNETWEYISTKQPIY